VSKEKTKREFAVAVKVFDRGMISFGAVMFFGPSSLAL
jgi:hypothetical protein